MASLKNLLKGKKKSSDKKKDSAYSSSGNLSIGSSKGGSQLNLSGSTDSLGYVLKEKDLSKFLKAAWQGDVNKLKQLSNKKTNWNETDKEQRTALHLACAKGFKPVVEYLISNGADTNKTDSEGKTPLMKACENSSIQIVDVLLRAGAHTNMYDANHMTALHIAAANGNEEIGQMLANRDAKLDAKDMNHVTPLHLSCLLGHMPFTEFLISEYIPINPLDNQKRTPLMTACIDGHIDTVQLLLQHDADPGLKDKDGLTAEDLAKKYNNDEIATVLHTFVNKKKKITSPAGSIHSKGSPHLPESPVDDVLNDILSPSSRKLNNDGGFASLFGGPATNVGGMGMVEKSEESQSEDLGDDSWADSDTDDFNAEKKTKGISLTAMMKKKEEDQSNVLSKKQNPKTEEPTPAPSRVTSKLPWQEDLSDEESESKWDDEDDDDDEVGTARNRSTQNKLDHLDGAQKPATKGSAVKLPPPTIKLDESQESVDFDSSIPDDGSFGDLPLSDIDGKNDKPKISFLKALNIKEEDEEDEDDENWDDSSMLPSQNQKEITKNNKDFKENDNEKSKGVGKSSSTNPPKAAVGDVGKSTKGSNQAGNDDGSEWDSDSPVSPEPSEEILPPRTPEPGSEFEPSTSGDEESDFSLGETKRKDSPLLSPKGNNNLYGSGIFQTEIEGGKLGSLSGGIGAVGGDFDSSDEDDEIEQQMKNLTGTKIPKTKETEQSPGKSATDNKPLANRQKQMADLGLDFGSDVSSVSDPEGLSASLAVPDGFDDEPKGVEDPNNNHPISESEKNPSDFVLSTDEESDDMTETESDWEREQRNKKVSKDVVKPPIIEETNEKIEETVTQQEPPVNQNPINNNALISEDGNDESSDFTFSENDDHLTSDDKQFGDPSQKQEKYEDEEGEDEAEALLLQQMEVAEANVNKEPSEDVISSSKQDLLDKEILEKRKHLLKEEEDRKAALEKAEADRKRALDEEEQTRRKALAEEEENTRRRIEAQQQEIQKKLALEEENKKKELEVETTKRMQELQDEENTRRKQLEQLENDLKARIQIQEKELEKIEAEKLKQTQELELENEKLIDLETSKEQTRLTLEEELDEIKGKIQSGREEMEESERNARKKEDEFNERLRKLQDEELRLKSNLDDSYLLEQDLTERNKIRDSLEMEEEVLREKLKKKIEKEEVERTRKFNEEYKAIEQDLENERNLKMQNLNDTIDQEKQKFYAQLEQEETEHQRKLSEEGRKFREVLEDDSNLLEQDLAERNKFRDSLEMEEEVLREKLKKKIEKEEVERTRKFNEEFENERNLKMQDLNDTIDQEKQKFYAKLEQEETERRRKLSEEGRKFRESLEAERERKLNELFNQSEEDKIEMFRKIKEEEHSKMSHLENEVKLKENTINERLNKMERDRLRIIEEKETVLEKEFREKLDKLEAEKLVELQKKETELSRLNAEVEAVKLAKKNEGFHDLERKSRLREKELEVQLMELRRKQVENDAAANKVILAAVHAAPVVSEDVIQATVNESNVEAGKDRLFLKDEIDYDTSLVPEDLTKNQKEKAEDAESVRNLLSRAKEGVDVAIEMIGSSAYEYPFDQQQHYSDTSTGVRYVRGASTPKPQMKHAYIGDDIEVGTAIYDLSANREKYLPQDRMRYHEIQVEMEEMQRTIESLNKTHNEKEKSRLDADLELQSLKYKLEQETEAKLMAERLCKQLKDQLSRSERKLMKEAESKQAMELANRKLQSEIKGKEQSVIKLDADINEFQILLEAEKENRILQEELYQEQLRHNEAILREAQKTSHNHVQAVTKLEILNESRRQGESATETLRLELAKTKGELARITSLLDEKQMQLDNDRNMANEKLQQKVQELAEVEKKLMQVQLQYENERANRENIENKLSTQLENETNVRKQLEVEIASLKNRLEHSNREIDRLGDKTSKNDIEARSHKENYIMEKFQLEKDMTLTQSELKMATEKIGKLEEDLKAAQGELKNTGRALAEHKDEMFGTHRNHQEARDTVKKLDDELRSQQVASAKFESQLEAAREKNTFFGEENRKLQGGLEKMKEILSTREKELADKNEKLATALGNIKDKSQQEKTQLILQNEQNKLLIDKIQNQLERKEEVVRENEDQIRKLVQELGETKIVLDNVQTENNVLHKNKDVMEKENSDLKQDVKQYEVQVDTLENTNRMMANEFSTTQSELDKTMQLSDEANKRLAMKSNDFLKLENANVELRTGLGDIKKQNMMIESDLREEKAKAEVLLQELQAANEARENLEGILGNVKGSNVLLEEKLHHESLNRTQREREAEENKNLWESEVKSRSKLGVQMIDLEKKIEEMKGQIEDERRKTRKVLEVKKSCDNKIEIYEQRSAQHQKEVAAMRHKLKQYQKRLKKYEGEDSDMDKERATMSSNVTKLRHQLKELSERLKREQQLRTEAEKNKRDQHAEMSELKTKEKVQKYEFEKLEGNVQSLQKDLAKQKDFYDKHFIPEESLEEFKQALERKCRLDLNKKLQEVNMHLEEQSLAREAFDKIRNDKEFKTRKELEDTILELKSELNEMRSTLHEGLAKRDTSQTEAKRYKDLFECEMCNTEKLASKLAQTTDLLSADRNRGSHFMDDSYRSPVSKQLFKEQSGQWPMGGTNDVYDVDRFRRTSSKYSTPLSKSTISPMKSPHKDLLLSSIKRRPLHS